MSIRAMNAAVRASAPSHAAKLVMMILAYHHNGKTGRCFPSYERIAEEGQMAKSTVIKAVKELEAAQLISKVKAKRAGTYSASNHYVLHFMQDGHLFTERERHHGYGRRAGSAALPKQESPTSTLRSEVGAKPKRKRSQRAKPRFRIDPAWAPAKKDRSVATAAGFSEAETNLMAETFRDYWISQGKTSADWSARWRMWVANQVRFMEKDDAEQRRTGPRGRPTDRLESIRTFDQQLRAGFAGGAEYGGLRRDGPEGQGPLLGGPEDRAPDGEENGPDG